MPLLLPMLRRRITFCTAFCLGLFTAASATFAHGQAPSKFLVLGVIASDNAENGVALLKDTSSGSTFAARTGEKLGGDISIAGVTRGYVYLVVAGKKMRIPVGDEFDPSAAPATGLADITKLDSGIERRGNSVTVTASLRDQLLKTQLSKVMMQAAAVPSYVNGELIGFKLLEIDPGSIYEKIGLVNGDIVTRLNGQKLGDVAAAVRVLQGLKNETKVEIAFLRNAAEQTLQLAVQ